MCVRVVSYGGTTGAWSCPYACVCSLGQLHVCWLIVRARLISLRAAMHRLVFALLFMNSCVGMDLHVCACCMCIHCCCMWVWALVWPPAPRQLRAWLESWRLGTCLAPGAAASRGHAPELVSHSMSRRAVGRFVSPCLRPRVPAPCRCSPSGALTLRSKGASARRVFVFVLHVHVI